MKYKEQEELVADLRSLANFFETPAAIELPVPSISISNYIYEYGKTEAGHTDYSKPDEFLTRLKMRSIAKILRNADKLHHGDQFELVRKFGRLKLTYRTSRESICTKKVVETKVVPAYTVPEYTQEIVEWECRDSLLA